MKVNFYFGKKVENRPEQKRVYSFYEDRTFFQNSITFNRKLANCRIPSNRKLRKNTFLLDGKENHTIKNIYIYNW